MRPRISIRRLVRWLVGPSVRWLVRRLVMLLSKSVKNVLLQILNDIERLGGRRNEQGGGGLSKEED